jgi:hypothetical protein
MKRGKRLLYNKQPAGRRKEGAMTILRGADGTVYKIPGETIKQYEIAPEDLEEKMKNSGVKPPTGIYPQQTKTQFTQIRLCLKR